jgi:hypothetical protein
MDEIPEVRWWCRASPKESIMLRSVWEEKAEGLALHEP